MTRYTATDAKGRVHKRSTENRTYTHAVVVDFSEYSWEDGSRTFPASTKVEWAGRLDLAQKNASAWHKRITNANRMKVVSIEIVPAVEVAR